jgi:SOS-response transcriptional repressor LexA
VRRPVLDDGPEPLRVTQRQLDLLRILRRWSVEKGRMPSLRELATVLDRSPSTVHQHLRALEKRGCLKMHGSAHGLELTVDDRQLGTQTQGALLPMKGVLYPGRRIRRSKTPYPKVSVGGLPGKADYVIQIEGDRLCSDGIYDGDLLVIRPGSLGDHPALIEFADGSCDVRRVTTLRDGSLGLLPPRPRLETRRGARRAHNVLVRGRVLRIVRIFE